jgi:hypothetical protein
MWFIRPNFEKLRRNLRKGILKGIYWILSRLRVGILYEFLRGFIERLFLLQKKDFFIFLKQGLNKFFFRFFMG